MDDLTKLYFVFFIYNHFFFSFIRVTETHLLGIKLDCINNVIVISNLTIGKI